MSKKGEWRLHLHWTAGGPGITPVERDSYHYITDAKGCTWSGGFLPEANIPPLEKGKYAAHTLNANSWAIGLALDAMYGAVEVPFDKGLHPITEVQLRGAMEFAAGLCRKYDIPVGPTRVLTHAEVQGNLGIKQNGKWDIMWIPGMEKAGKPREVGDVLRAMIKEYL